MMKAINVDEIVHERIKELAGELNLSMGEYLAQLVGVDVVRKKPGARRGDNYDQRMIAQERGEKTYQGNPCTYGHGGERYVGTNKCVGCHRIRSSMKNPMRESMQTLMMRHRMVEAKTDEGAPMYFSYTSDAPCRMCGSSERWLKNGLCFHCYAGNGQRVR